MAVSYLVLEDGAVFEGEAFGYGGGAFGEVVFTTGMDGYQEGITDPSSRGEILVCTYPTIGNYGVDVAFEQSAGVHIRGLVVRELCERPSRMYGGAGLGPYLERNRVPGISGVDTRELATRIRGSGTMRGAIVRGEEGVPAALERVRSEPAPSEGNLVAEVSCRDVLRRELGKGLTVGLIDCGVRDGLLRSLCSRFNVVQFPYDAAAQAVADAGVDGVVVSGGPGDPAHPEIVRTTVRAVADLCSRLPVMGVDLGCAIVALALGGRTYKMKVGHRGCNQPVRLGGRIYITSQSHGHAVDAESLDGTGLSVDQANVNDGTAEGVSHADLPVSGVQYRPEACPGPWDTGFLFDRFGRTMGARR